MCDCIARVNAELETKNTFLVEGKLDHTKGRAALWTRAINPFGFRTWQEYLFADFCPFCGAKYPEANEEVSP
jgi:hypothetical protein